jgi:hypothetical protein
MLLLLLLLLLLLVGVVVVVVVVGVVLVGVGVVVVVVGVGVAAHRQQRVAQRMQDHSPHRLEYVRWAGRPSADPVGVEQHQRLTRQSAQHQAQ